MIYQGIDVSSAQGQLSDQDWAAISKTYTFAILECFVGNDYKSSTYEANKTNATNAGLRILPYHFLYAGLPTDNNPLHINRDPVKQATLHYAACNSKAVADLEWPTDFNGWNTSPAAVVDWTHAYLERYKILSGEYPILYSYPYYLKSLGNPDFSYCQLWIASYAEQPTIPAPFSTYVLWQYSSTGHLPNGAQVDLDCCTDISIFD